MIPQSQCWSRLHHMAEQNCVTFPSYSELLIDKVPLPATTIRIIVIISVQTTLTTTTIRRKFKPAHMLTMVMKWGIFSNTQFSLTFKEAATLWCLQHNQSYTCHYNGTICQLYNIKRSYLLTVIFNFHVWNTLQPGTYHTSHISWSFWFWSLAKIWMYLLIMVCGMILILPHFIPVWMIARMPVRCSSHVLCSLHARVPRLSAPLLTKSCSYVLNMYNFNKKVLWPLKW